MSPRIILPASSPLARLARRQVQIQVREVRPPAIPTASLSPSVQIGESRGCQDLGESDFPTMDPLVTEESA